jgi:peptide/nickel transport system substrate-binding protein
MMMFHKGSWVKLLVSLVVTSLILVACGPQPTAETVEKVVTQVVKETVVVAGTPQEVEKEVTKVVEVPVVVTATPEAEEQPPAGSTEGYDLVIAIENPIDHFDPQWTYVSSHAPAWACVFDTLLWRDKDMNIIPWLATSWEKLSDTEWVLELRQDVKFHNGEPFNAETVKYNVERATAEGFQRWAFLAPLAGAEVLDDYTVKISTKAPTPTFLALMTMFFMVPPEYTKEVGSEGLTAHPVGTGPFKFVEYVPDSYTLLERNDEWWNGKHQFKTVKWLDIPETSTRMAALRAGEVDIARNVPPDEVANLDSMPDLKVVSVAGIRTPYIAMFPDSPMGGGEPLNDLRVRQALNYAIDVDAIIEHLLAGRGSRVSTLMTPALLGYDPALQPYEYDPEKAKALLAEAGYPDGFTIQYEVAYNMPGPKPVEISTAIADYLAQVGIKVDLLVRDMATMQEKQRNRTWAPLAMWTYGASTLDPDSKFWGPFSTGGTMHFISPPELNDLIDRGRTEMDGTKRAEIYKELQTMVHDMALTIPLFAQHDIYAGRESIEFDPWPNEILYVPNIIVK